MTDRLTEIRESHDAGWPSGRFMTYFDAISYLLDQIAERDAEVERQRKYIAGQKESVTQLGREHAERIKRLHAKIENLGGQP